MKTRKIFLALVFLTALVLGGCSDHPAIACVKNSHARNRNDVTFGDACWYAFQSAKWKVVEQISENNYYVVVQGKLFEPESEISLPTALKFKVNISTDSWTAVEVRAAGEKSTSNSDIREALDFIYAIYDEY